MKPEEIQATYGRALALQNAGKLSEAAGLYQQILNARDLAEPAFQMGLIATRTGQRIEAVKWFERSLRKKPKQVEIWKALLDVLPPQDRPRAIEAARKQGVVLGSKMTRAMRDGSEAIAKGDLTRARQILKKTLALAGDEKPGVYLHWGQQLAADGHSVEALAVYDRAIADLDPAPFKIRRSRATALVTLGRLDDAETELRGLLADFPEHPVVLAALVQLKRQTADRNDVAELEQALEKAPGDPSVVRAMTFAAAKGLEDLGEYDRAFAHLSATNRMTREQFPWDHEADRNHLQVLLEQWEPKANGHTGLAPIFVVGLPRSGTTLIETILSMHKDVVPGGETGLFNRIFRPADTALLEGDPSYEPGEIGRDFARAFSKKLGIKGNNLRGTDKSITTYARIGHVLNCLPDARFVVVKRDPRDVGLSIFKNQFEEGQQRFSADLVSIARQINFFDAAIAAWQARVPRAMQVVSYDALVTDPEPQVRAMLEFCGLDWEPACLTPQKSDRSITTLSVVQARNPINPGSLGAWHRYETHLAPLLAALQTEKTSFDQ